MLLFISEHTGCFTETGSAQNQKNWVRNISHILRFQEPVLCVTPTHKYGYGHHNHLVDTVGVVRTVLR